MTKTEKTAIIKQYALSEKDVGSSDVQIAILTARVNELTVHLQTHTKDTGATRGLTQMVCRRRRLLTYVEREDHARYTKLIESLGLRR